MVRAEVAYIDQMNRQKNERLTDNLAYGDVVTDNGFRRAGAEALLELQASRVNFTFSGEPLEHNVSDADD